MQRRDFEVHWMPSVTGPKEIHVHAVREALWHSAAGCDQGLCRDVAAGDVMPYFVDLVSDEELRVDLFEVERVEELAQRDDGRRRGHARIMPLRQVAAKPLQHPPPGILGSSRVVARSGVVEKRMV